MKKYIVSAIAVLGLLAASSVASAQTTLSGAAGTAVDNVKVSRTGDNMRVRMDVDLSRCEQGQVRGPSRHRHLQQGPLHLL